jgi:hypothetical protein
VSRSAAGDTLIALLADEIEPTVVVRRYSNGDTESIDLVRDVSRRAAPVER